VLKPISAASGRAKLADMIDTVIRRHIAKNEKVLAEAKRRYERFRKISETATTLARKKSAKRNMEIVVYTLRDSQERFDKMLEKLKKLRPKKE